MTTHRYLATLMHFATVLLFLVGFAPQSFCGSTSRPITSLTADERMKLPGETQVTLHSGRTTTLAVLRKEHELRMQRFKTAAQLGRAIAGKLTKPAAEIKTALAPQASVPDLKQSARGAGSKTGTGATGQQMPGNAISLKGAVKPASGASASSVEAAPRPPASAMNRLITMVPDQYIASQSFLPRDYLAACSGPATACLYLPANTSLNVVATVAATINLVAEDEDPLITDQSGCFYDGGSIDDGTCVFRYPLSVLENFKPAGKLSTTASCDPSMQFILDQMGAIKVWFGGPPASGVSITTQSNPVTCAVQVWVSQ